MKTPAIVLVLTLFFISSLNATIWRVGATRTYTMPAQVAPLVTNGDTVDIDAGVYASDVCAWTANNLLIRGVNGMAHLKSNGLTFGDKAIWVIQGNNTTVENVEFSQATSTSSNGAGVRQEGKNLTLRRCYFHENENGILANGVSGSKITIEYCEFKLNGATDGYSHNVYIGAIDTLLFRYNYSHHCKMGHELKSRAHVNYVLYNRLSNELNGTASYNIDLPNGGLSVIMGNVLQKGLNSNNSTLIAYGLESLTNPAAHNLYVVNNTLINDRANGTFVSMNNATSLYKSYNNIFAGTGTIFSGNATTIDTVGNKKGAVSAFGFVNASTYDYHLSATSMAVNAGTNTGVASNGFALTPVAEYNHPAGYSLRNNSGAIDAGAYELAGIVSIKELNTLNAEILYVPNDYLKIESQEELSRVNVVSIEGKLIYENNTLLKSDFVSVKGWTSGIYVVSTYSKSGAALTKKFIIP